MSARKLSEAEAVKVKATIDAFTNCLVGNDFEKWITYWAEDAVLMPPGHARLFGRDAILGFVRENFGALDLMENSEWQIFGEGETAIVTTNNKWKTTGDSSGPQIAKQVIVCCKDGDGNWQMQLIMYNAGV